MSQYKELQLPDELDNVIEHMKEVDGYREELTILGQSWDLLTILGQMEGGNTDMTTTREGFRKLTEDLVSGLGSETLGKVVQDISGKAEVIIDIIIRNLFERTADIGFLAADNDIRSFLQSNQQISCNTSDQSEQQLIDINQLHSTKTDDLIKRFNEYVAKYSVYHNIILLDTTGNVLAQLDESNPIEKSNDPLIQEALRTSEDYVESFRYSDLLPNEESSLIYSFKVTENNNASSKSLGVLCLCFRFENEMQSLFDKFSSEDDWSILTLLDKDGKVIASNSPYQVPVGVTVEMVLTDKFKIIKFGGQRYIAKTLASLGYQEFYGLGWHGHVMLPIAVAFESNCQQIVQSVEQSQLDAVLGNKQLFSKKIQNIPVQADRIQADLDRTIWNGNLTTGTENNSTSKVLLWEISKVGLKTKNVFSQAIGNLYKTVVSTHLSDVEFLSSMAIDIMDRNLYERANDCRWWALTAEFQTILSKPQIENSDALRIKEILSYINDLYTVYTNLFVYDLTGKVIAVSNPKEDAIVGSIIQAEWINKTLKIQNSQVYSVSPFEQSHLYSDKHTYIYNAAITSLDNSAKIIGGIGIVFDSEPQFKDILLSSLPKNLDGEHVKGSFSVFTDGGGHIISSSLDELHVGENLDISSSFFDLTPGASSSGIITFRNQHYAIGVTRSNGYREYKSDNDTYQNEVFSFVFFAMGSVNEQKEKGLAGIHRKFESFQNPGSDENLTEIATFYIDNRCYGIRIENIIEALEFQHLPHLPGSPESIIGSIIFHNEPILVLNPGSALDNYPDMQSENLQTIVIQSDHGPIGIVVESLGEIPKINKSQLSEESILGSNNLSCVEAIASANSNDDNSPLIIVLNPTDLVTLLIGEPKKNECILEKIA